MKEDKYKSLAIFETFKIRRHYDEEKETWYFSVIDIVGALTDQPNYQIARKYWNKLSERLKNEGSEVVTNCHRLKMVAQDGKMRETDVADVETILRLVQSVPSKKAEPIKLWLAKVGYERLEEINNPERALNRSREYWKKHGRSEKWIQQRMLSQETRNKLTDYWGEHGVEKKDEFAILTNIIHKEWSELTVKEHKTLKGLKTQNLRDHMSEAELIFTALAELSTRQIAETDKTEDLKRIKSRQKKGVRLPKMQEKLLNRKPVKA
ncbi:MAG TPA: BRO family protein [Ignavibacteriaceae bacterium]|nr:BRO family protein [Ignavibacteriaceae bacterium]